MLWGVLTTAQLAAQKSSKKQKREARKEHINALAKQEEDGSLIYNKQFVTGVQINTDGYGIFLEWGKLKTPNLTELYSFGFYEKKHRKEEKVNDNASNGIIGGQFLPYVFGKTNYFYQAVFSYGRQQVLGTKSNKNGVAVSAIYKGGLSLGLLRGYNIQIDTSASINGRNLFTTTYKKANALQKTYFADPDRVFAGTGISKGWNELKFNPGIKLEGGLRFDFGRHNELCSAAQLTVSAEYYAQKVQQLLFVKERNLFINVGVAFVFGRRK
jgi:hypothetical protein